MNDCIDRNLAEEKLLGLPAKIDEDGYVWTLRRDAFHVVSDAPKVDQICSEWVWDENGMDWNLGAWKCSNCGNRSSAWWNTERTSPMIKSGHKYCSHCGAYMTGVKKD